LHVLGASSQRSTSMEINRVRNKQNGNTTPAVPSAALGCAGLSRASARIALILPLLLVLVTPAIGQTASPTSRPQIGLALAGGSALGLAHVGVLQWLEEHHIPVDYVAGTSMGGLMGGTYATGLSSTEMHALLKSINWREMLATQTPYTDLDF